MGGKVFLGICIWTTFALIGEVSCQTEDEKVNGLTEDFLEWRFEDAPEYAIKFGIPGYGDKVQSFTEDTFLNRKNKASEFLQEAEKIDLSKVTRQNEISVALLKVLTKTIVTGYDYRVYSMYNPVSPLGSPYLDWKSMVGKPAYDKLEDYTDLLMRYEKLPQQVDEIIVLMKEAIKMKKTQHEVSVTSLISSLDVELSTSYTESGFYKPFKSMPEEFTNEVKNNITERANDSMTTQIHPAWKKFNDFLKTEYLPNTRKEIGVSSLEGGTEFYQKCLDWHLSVSMTPREVHDLGVSEVARIRALMTQTMKDSGFDGSLADFLVYLKEAPENLINDESELLSFCEGVVAEAQSKLDYVLNDIPKTLVTVQLLENLNGPTGRYSSPSADGSRPGIYWINRNLPRPKSDLVALSLHEAVPGHHTQESYALEHSQPLFRRLTEYRYYEAVPFNWLFHTSYSEGWALYAEYLGEEIGMYKTDFAKFGRYASEIHRAVRLVVDTGMHMFNMSRDDAVKYMRDNTVLSEIQVENEINRYISWPGQACAYKIGELKIKQLRAKAEEEIGDDFDVRDFHAQIMDLGNVPLSILDDTVYQWIEKTKATSAAIPLATVKQSCLFLVFVSLCHYF